MEFELRVLTLGLLAPGLISLISLMAATRIRPGRLRAASGAVIFLALLLCYFALRLGPLQPAEAWQWLPWLALTVTLAGLPSSHIAILEIFYVLIVLLATPLLVPNIERLALERGYWLLAVPTVLLVSITSSILLARSLDGPALPFYWLLITLAGTVLTFFASLNTFAHLGGMLAAVVAACLVATYIFPTHSLTAIIAPGWAAFFAGLVLEARLATFSEVPFSSFVLILIAPFTIWLTAIPGVRKMKPIWRTTLGTFCVLAPLAIGLALAGQVALRDVEDW